MKLKIKHITLIEAILLVVTFGGLITSTFNLSNLIYYIADLLNIIIFIFSVKKILKDKIKKNVKFVNIVIFLFIICIIIGLIINNVSLKLVLWGARNLFRFLLFFFSCITLLTKEDVEKIFMLIIKLFWINFIITIIQFFLLGIKGDYLGGIFGTLQGCNGATIIFTNIVIIYVISKYLNKGMRLGKMLLYLIAYFIITALAEIKGNFVFFVIEAIALLMITKKSRKTMFFCSIAIISLIIGINILTKYFPDTINVLMDLDSANRYMNATYFGTTTFTRNGIFKVANEMFFRENTNLYLFGYGLGACDTSSYFSSPFFAEYGYMNYRQYGIAMTLLQNGYIGLFLYIMFFISCAIYALKNKRVNNTIYSAVVFSVVIFAILDSFYASLYIDSAYYIFFIMAIPYILSKDISK